MKNSLSSILLILLNLIIAIGNVNAETEKYRIAAIIPLSGQIASLGTYVKKGLDLGLESLSPELRSKIELVYEDDQFNPQQTLTAYRKLKATGRLDAVFIIGSPPGNALVPVTEHDKTLLMGIGSSDPTIAVGRQYSFIHWVIPPVLGDRLAEQLIEKNLGKIAFVTSEVSGTIAIAEAAMGALKKKGKAASIIYSQNFTKETTDFKPALLKIKSKGADAVVASLMPGSLSIFAKQFRGLGLPAELVGIETFEDESEVKASSGALIGGWYVNASDGTDDFVSLYKKRYGEQAGWGTANAYDSIRLMAAAVERKGLNNDGIATYLREIKDYHGATGVYSSSGDNRFTLPAAVKVVTAAGFENVPQ